MSTYRGGNTEGLGAPIEMDPYKLGGIDPSLEDCCRREVRAYLRCMDAYEGSIYRLIMILNIEYRI
jgi:hypothetical protein